MGNCICTYCCLHFTSNKLPLYKLNGIFKAKVVDVYDGDTVTVILINKCGFEKHKLRLYGIDTPEMAPRLNDPNRENIKKNAKLAKNKLQELILNKNVSLNLIGYDKYGRLLGTIYKKNFCSKININKFMLDNGYAKEYYGGTKN